MSKDDGFELRTIPEAAKIFHVSDKKVWSDVYARRIESVKIGRSRRIPLRAILALIERGTIPVEE